MLPPCRLLLAGDMQVLLLRGNQSTKQCEGARLGRAIKPQQAGTARFLRRRRHAVAFPDTAAPPPRAPRRAPGPVARSLSSVSGRRRGGVLDAPRMVLP
jgi:hypothetical protein